MQVNSNRQIVVFFLFSFLLLKTAAGQHITGVIPAGVAPSLVASNPVTHRIYVANNSHNILVIDGDTYTVIATVSNGAYSAAGFAINPLTNKIYVANSGICCPEATSTVTVIDGATNATTTVGAGYSPIAVAVNPVTNKIYVANGGTIGFGVTDPGSITVIDGATNTAITFADPRANSPNAVAVNPVTNKIYVANLLSNNVTVIDGNSNAITDLPAGASPGAVAVNPVANKIYVANSGSDPPFDPRSVTVIDGASNAITTVNNPNAIGPNAVAINPVTNKIYVVNSTSGNMTVIDGATNSFSTINVAGSIAIDSISNQVYVAAGNLVTAIDGATNTATGVPAATLVDAADVVVNPVTNKIFVADKGDTGIGGGNAGDILVFDGATNATVSVPAGLTPVAAAVNPVTNRIYVPNNGASAGPSVTVIDGATDTPVTTVSAGSNPTAAVVNPITNKIYVASSPNVVTVIDGATNATTAVTVGTTLVALPSAVAVNPATNKIYVANSNNANVTVIDGATNKTTTVGVGNSPIYVAVNPVNNKIYVSNQFGNSVTVIDGATNATTTVSVGMTPGAVAVNPATGRVYVANTAGNTFSVIDGTSNLVIATVNTGTFPAGIAVNPLTNRIYVCNRTSGGIWVFDGATNALLFSVGAGTNPAAMLFNPLTNKVYVANYGSNNVTVLDAAFTLTAAIAAGTNPRSFGFNPFTNKIYAANGGSHNVTVIAEQHTQNVPLTTTIAPLAGNQTNLTTPTFNFATSSSYQPATPPVQSMYFQLDSWQGPWLKATGTAPNFSGTSPPLLQGVHIVYAYSADAQIADGSNADGNTNSPAIGNIAAYLFVVGPSPTSTALSLTSGTNPSNFGQSLTFTASLTPATATGTVQFLDGGLNLGAPAVVSNGAATLTTAMLSVGVHRITAAYSGDNNFAPSISSSLTQVVIASGGAVNTSTALAVTPKTFFRQSVLFSVQVTPTSGGPATGNVILLDAGTQLGPMLTLGSGGIPGGVTFSSPLHSSVHNNLQAIYLGNANFNGSFSSAQSVNASPKPKPR